VRRETVNKLPKKITIYNYYGAAIYFDNTLYSYVSHEGANDARKWASLCHIFGIEFRWNDVPWQDMPGAGEESKNIYKPPLDLIELENHFARLIQKRAFEDIERQTDLLNTLVQQYNFKYAPKINTLGATVLTNANDVITEAKRAKPPAG
jgi:hypothetical protein